MKYKKELLPGDIQIAAKCVATDKVKVKSQNENSNIAIILK